MDQHRSNRLAECYLTVQVQIIHESNISLRFTANEADTVWLAAVALLRFVSEPYISAVEQMDEWAHP